MLIRDIIIGDRHRRDLGDVDALARSIAAIGLLHPVVVTPAGVLIAGARRLAACQRLGWSDIPVTVVDLADVVRGERAENEERKDFTPSEMVAIRRATEPAERDEAKARQGQRTDLHPEKFTGSPGVALDRVAAGVGVSRPTLEKATAVVEAAEQEPELFGDLVAKMDETGKVDAAYKKLQERKREAERAALASALATRTFLPIVSRMASMRLQDTISLARCVHFRATSLSASRIITFLNY